MQCKKKEKRSLLDLFKIYNCVNCKNYLDDEVIKIGYKCIKIFYFKRICRFEKNNNFYNNSIKNKLIFKDILISELKKEKNIFLWLEYYDNFSNYFCEFEYFLNSGYNIIIII